MGADFPFEGETVQHLVAMVPQACEGTKTTRLCIFQWVNELVLGTDPKGRTSCLLHDQTPWSFPTHNRKEFAPDPDAKGPLALAARGGALLT